MFKKWFKKSIYLAVAVFLIVYGIYLLKADFIPFLQWWAVIMGLGLIFLPLSELLFSAFQDKGFLFSKTIGIAVTGYLMWLFSSLHLLKYTTLSCIITVFLAILSNVSLMVFRKRHHQKMNIGGKPIGFLKSMQQDTIDLMIKEEILFFALFLIFAYIRGFKPEAYGTEKFMDYGFMTTIMRSDYLPPQDFWFSGTKLNYYYVGQYLATFLTKLSFVETSDAYNLMLMMTGAFAFMLPYSLGYNLTYQFAKDRSKKKAITLPGISGLIAGAGVCLAGTMHYPIYKWFLPNFHKLFRTGMEIKRYWFPDATRYIGYNPETNDKTIHEFPSYSFVLGDLHAHVINILFVLTVLGILLAWLFHRLEKREDKLTIVQEVFQPAIILIGFFIGLFHTTNYWDFPIYFIVSGAVILFCNMIVYNFKGKAYWMTALQGIFVFVMGKIICLPFTLNFDKISAEPLLAVAHTPFYQLMVLWGLPIVTVFIFLSYLISDFIKDKDRIKKRTAKKKEPGGLVLFMQRLSASDLFVLTIGLCAVGLILLPEIVYIKDIYSGDYKRANTMFKLTYQAFILFGICFGYIFTRMLKYGSTKGQKITATVGLILFSLTLFYVGNATNSWYGNIFHREGYKGLDATAFMEEDFPEDAVAARWLNENISGTPIVLEANGLSYTEYQRISVITGLPTVLGWYTHEQLWKSQPGISNDRVTARLDKRAEDIQKIYTLEEKGLVRLLINNYNVDYIYVGGLEQKKYENVNHELLKSIGEVVFELPATDEKPYETYIVKVSNDEGRTDQETSR